MKTAIAMREDKMAIEYIDREKAKRLLHIEYAYAAEQLLDEIPAVDAEVVVRCKDCKHSTLPSELTQRYGVPGTLTCHNRHSPCNRRNVGGDDFCSYGERKDGGAK